MDGLSMNQVNRICRSDISPPNNIRETYSEPIIPIILEHWDEINCSMTLNPELYCSQFSYRLSMLRPTATIDYWPEKIGHHPAIVAFAKRILIAHFTNRAQCVYVNFSPSIIVIEQPDEDMPVTDTQFLYSSRGNFGCLPTSYLIHDQASFDHFFDEILPNYSLDNYISGVIESLDRKYEGSLVPVNLVFHLVKENHRLYGKEEGITAPCCKSHVHNDCLWNVLSSCFDVHQGMIQKGVIKKTSRSKINRRRSL